MRGTKAKMIRKAAVAYDVDPTTLKRQVQRGQARVYRYRSPVHGRWVYGLAHESD